MRASFGLIAGANADRTLDRGYDGCRSTALAAAKRRAADLADEGPMVFTGRGAAAPVLLPMSGQRGCSEAASQHLPGLAAASCRWLIQNNSGWAQGLTGSPVT